MCFCLLLPIVQEVFIVWHSELVKLHERVNQSDDSIHALLILNVHLRKLNQAEIVDNFNNRLVQFKEFLGEERGGIHKSAYDFLTRIRLANLLQKLLVPYLITLC